jgi:hypothetical protein
MQSVSPRAMIIVPVRMRSRLECLRLLFDILPTRHDVMLGLKGGFSMAYFPGVYGRRI